MRTTLFLLTLLLPLLAGLLLWLCPPLGKGKTRSAFVIGALGLCLACNVALVMQGDGALHLFTIGDKLPVVLQSDALSRCFSLLVGVMWLLSGVFSLRYMQRQSSPTRYYVFYLLTLFALMGVGYAGTLVTIYLFFEMMTLLSVALVLHEKTPMAVAAGVKYLLYSVAGAMMGLFGVFYLSQHTEAPLFTPGGSLSPEAAGTGLCVAALFVCLVGFGVKAGMFPLHGWLPTAHPVAPAPASAVLSGIITKTGVLCVLRVIYYVAGPSALAGTWAQTALLALALITVFMGSMLAYREPLLKKRLAYSSVSQVSYVLFGLYALQQTALNGALLHVAFHAIMKDGLFLCAGAIIYQTGRTRVDELCGIGKEMPVTMACWTILSLGLIGVPPTCGFFSKWNLATGALGSAAGVFTWLGPVVLLLSALLTAGYLLPLSVQGYFPGDGVSYTRREVSASMLWPIVLLALLCVLLGVLPNLIGAPLGRIAAMLLP